MYVCCIFFQAFAFKPTGAKSAAMRNLWQSWREKFHVSRYAQGPYLTIDNLQPFKKEDPATMVGE